MASVLIVDDDKSTLTMLRLHLARAGFETAGALEPPAALHMLRERPFDWLLVDGQLGHADADGFELAARAKSLRPGLRVVMVSGLYEPADIGEAPIERLFQKPVDVDRLLSYMGPAHSA